MVPSVRLQTFSEFLTICDFFQEVLGAWNNSEIWETSKIFVNITRSYCAMTSLWLTCQNIKRMRWK